MFALVCYHPRGHANRCVHHVLQSPLPAADWRLYWSLNKNLCTWRKLVGGVGDAAIALAFLLLQIITTYFGYHLNQAYRLQQRNKPSNVSRGRATAANHASKPSKTYGGMTSGSGAPASSQVLSLVVVGTAALSLLLTAAQFWLAACEVTEWGSSARTALTLGVGIHCELPLAAVIFAGLVQLSSNCLFSLLLSQAFRTYFRATLLCRSN